jgi:DNA-binding MarR family transcriptional regulator
MVALLERDRLVMIQPSPTDGRSRIIELTPEGRDLPRAAPLWREAQRQFNEMNGTANVGALRRSLSEIRAGDGVISSFE